MISAFALSRRDGSVADGVHLGWSTRPLGYAVNGFSVWRRPIYQPEVDESCHQVSGVGLERLHRSYRVTSRDWHLVYQQVAREQSITGEAIIPWHRYEVRVPGPCTAVRIRARSASFAIGVRSEKATSRHRFNGEYANLEVSNLE
ncbi:MAG: hypothetical protein AAGF12_09680, partial [Myxococcota bacterium]